MMEPDEDEDPTRICVKCGIRPRWSRHGQCTRCVECAGKAVAYCIRVRKEPTPVESIHQSRTERYHRLRRAGASAMFARRYCRSPGGFQMGMRQLGASHA